MLAFQFILLQVVSVVLGSARIPSVNPVPVPETESKISTELGEGFDAEEIRGLESVTKAEPEPESDSSGSFTIRNNADFPISVPSSHNTNYIQSENTNYGNTKKDSVLKVMDIPSDLLEWEAPYWFQKNVPYYLAGYDEEDRPVWIAEWGKYPIRELTLLEDEEAQIFDKYLKQMAARIYKSIADQANTTENEGKIFALIDLDELDLNKIAHPKSILVILKLFTAYQKLILDFMAACIVINVNYVSEAAINLLRPILGRSLDNIEFYGTNPAKWKPQLLRRLPKNVLPSWYGGSADFTPVKVYG